MPIKMSEVYDISKNEAVIKHQPKKKKRYDTKEMQIVCGGLNFPWGDITITSK